MMQINVTLFSSHIVFFPTIRYIFVEGERRKYGQRRNMEVDHHRAWLSPQNGERQGRFDALTRGMGKA